MNFSVKQRDVFEEIFSTDGSLSAAVSAILLPSFKFLKQCFFYKIRNEFSSLFFLLESLTCQFFFAILLETRKSAFCIETRIESKINKKPLLGISNIHLIKNDKIDDEFAAAKNFCA